MNRPRVIIHNLISLDGRLDGFPADAGLYYEMTSRLPHRLIADPGGPDAVALELTAVERLRHEHVWLRYAVRGGR